MITMKNIAEAANVSRTTVSFVLSGRCEKDQKISPQVVKKVRETAEKLGYIPNDYVQGLVKGKSRVLGIISSFPDFIMPIVRGYSDEAARHGYSLRLIPLESDDLSKALMTALRSRLEGVSLLGVTDEMCKGIDWDFFDSKLTISRSRKDGEKESDIFDQRLAAMLAVEHLVEKGYKKIFCITTPAKNLQLRKEGYLQVMKKYALPDHVFSYEGNEDFYKKIIEAVPEAVFCASDYIAAQLLQEMNRKKLFCPEAFAVAGFGNTTISRFTSPPLTTVEEPYYESAILGCRKLIHKVHTGKDLTFEKLTGKLIVRESTL